MRHARSLSLTLQLFAVAGQAIAVPAAPDHLEKTTAREGESTAPRRLRLAIVDAHKASAAREVQHRLLTASLAAGASVRAGEAVWIDATCVSAGEAKARFLSGECSAVLVLGENRPLALRRLSATTYCGMLEPEGGVRPVYLFVASAPDAAQVLLTEAFNRMLGDRAALRAIIAAGEGAVMVGIAQ